MALNWTNLQSTVYKILKKQGFALKVRVPGSSGVFNSTTLVYDGATADSDIDTYGIKASYSIREIDGTIIQSGDTKLLFPAYGLGTVTPDNTIVIDSVEINVINVKPIDPGNVTLLYECQTRG